MAMTPALFVLTERGLETAERVRAVIGPCSVVAGHSAKGGESSEIAPPVPMTVDMPVGSSAIDTTLPWVRGCRAWWTHPRSNERLPVVLLDRDHVGECWVVVGVAMGMPKVASTSSLRLVYHPAWDAAALLRTSLRLHGGWRMNFSGLMHSFAKPVRPQRISYAVKVATPCSQRSFFNVFFSSAPNAYADQPVFYAGSPAHPPQPHDVFSLLLDTQASGGQTSQMLWLPSGYNAAGTADFMTNGMKGNLTVGEWHRVVLELDWSNERLMGFVDGVPLSLLTMGHTAAEAGVESPHLFPFGPHKHLRRRHAVADEDPEHAAERGRVVSEMREGFRHLYLFTWLENADDDDDVPDVHIADLWVE